MTVFRLAKILTLAVDRSRSVLQLNIDGYIGILCNSSDEQIVVVIVVWYLFG